MSNAGLLIALLIILVAGTGLTRLLGGSGREFRQAEFAALSLLLGAGYVSLAMWLFGLALSGFPLLAAVIIGATALIILGNRKKCAFARHEPLLILDWLLLAILAAQAVFIVWWASRLALGWDGLMIWEFKARLAVENGGAIPAAYFSDTDRVWSHPYYPLGLPGLETWLQASLGRVDQAWLRIIGPLYYFAAAALIVTGTQRLGGTRRTGLAAAVAFFFVPYIFAGTWGVLAGYADFPLGALFLAALIYLPRAGESPGDARLCSALAALCVWEKSEGRILWLTLAALTALTLLPRKRWRTWLVLALPGAAVLIAFKLFLAARHTITETTYLPATVANILSHADRLGPILTQLARELANLESWGLLWPGAALALIALALRGERARALTFAATLLLPLAAYLFAFVLTSWTDYASHMDLALPRLLLQLAPAAVLVIALAVPPPFSLAKRVPANEDQPS